MTPVVVRGFASRVLPKSFKVRVLVVGGIVLSAGATAVVVFVVRDCTPPLARVATTPAMLGTYRTLADAFEGSAAGNCTELYVYAIPSMAEAVAAFQADWAATTPEARWSHETMVQAGPKPDLLLAESTAAVNLIGRLAPETQAASHVRGSVASSPLVIAKLVGGQPPPETALWSELLERPDGETQAQRPQQANPTTSALGLLTTTALYQFGMLEGGPLTGELLADRNFQAVQQAVGIGGEDQDDLLDLPKTRFYPLVTEVIQTEVTKFLEDEKSLEATVEALVAGVVDAKNGLRPADGYPSSPRKRRS